MPEVYLKKRWPAKWIGRKKARSPRTPGILKPCKGITRNVDTEKNDYAEFLYHLDRRSIVSEITLNEQAQAGQGQMSCLALSGECVGRAVDSFVASMEALVTGRGWPMMVRVDGETLAKLDLLVSGGVCKSRVEALGFLLQRGVESSESLLARISKVEGQIGEMKGELVGWVQESEG
jgi:hypothetical protein